MLRRLVVSAAAVITAAEQSTFATAYPCLLLVGFLVVMAALLVRSARNRRHRTVRMYGQLKPKRAKDQWRGR